MQNESKGVYVQMPKPEPVKDNEAERLLADIVSELPPHLASRSPYLEMAYRAAKKYLEKNKVLSEATV